MGAKVSKLHTSSKREAKALSSNLPSSSKKSSIIEAVKPDCLKRRKVKKNQTKSTLQSPESRTKVRNLTLEDWLLASSGPTGSKPDSFNGCDFYVFKHISRRVHPSFSREQEAVPYTTGDCFSMDLSWADVSHSSFCKNRSAKLKKKVSFRLPEEADIVIFYSPEAIFGNDQQSF